MSSKKWQEKQSLLRNGAEMRTKFLYLMFFIQMTSKEGRVKIILNQFSF